MGGRSLSSHLEVVLEREIFKQKAGKEGSGCGVGNEGRPPGHQGEVISVV